MIKAIRHVALQVPNLDDSVRWATGVMGLREVKRDGRTSYLTHGRAHHSLIYIEGAEGALDHISLEAADESALDQLNDALANKDFQYLTKNYLPKKLKDQDWLD